MVETGGDGLRRPEPRLRGERLELDQHGAGPLHQRRHRRPRDARRAAREERGGGVGDGLEPGGGHLEDTDFIDRAEAILDGAENAVIERALAFEVEHRIHDVLEGLRARDAAALGHVSDEQHGGSGFLGEAHQTGGTLAHLADVAGGAFEFFRVGRLDRVEQHDAGPQRRRVVHDRLEPRLAQHVNVAGVLAQAVGAETELFGGFLAGDVEGPDAGALEARRDLHQQRGLPDPRLTADQGHRARDDAAPEDEVELLETGLPALHVVRWNVGKLDRARAGRTFPTFHLSNVPSDRLLDQRIPRPARIALARPFRLLGPAVGATKYRATFRHGRALEAVLACWRYRIS